jgi:hypothetical protein
MEERKDMSPPLYENLPEKINKNKHNLPENFKDLVYCIGWHQFKDWGEVEIASDFSVYPCCTLHAEHQLEKTFFDKKLDNLDKDWNNLKKHKLKDILKTWRNHIKPEFWKKEETLPECCGHLCKIR